MGEQGVWGGRKDSSGKLYIGLECSTSEDVVAVELEQGSGHHVSGVEIQKNEGAGWNSIATVSVSQADALETIWPAPTGWRLMATTSSSDWAWDVKRLKFVTASGVLATGGSGDCVVVDSGHKDSSGKLYIGLECSTSADVVAVDLEQGSGHHVSEVVFQEKRRSSWGPVATVPVGQTDALERIWSEPLV